MTHEHDSDSKPVRTNRLSALWGNRRAYSLLTVAVGLVVTSALWTFLTTVQPRFVSTFPDPVPPVAFVLLRVAPVAALYWLNRGIVPTFLVALFPTYTIYRYNAYFVPRVYDVFVDPYASVFHAWLLTETFVYWSIGLAIALAYARFRAGGPD